MWAVGAMQVPVAHAVAAGSLIKASGAAVYYLATDGKRYTFPNDKIYRTWYTDFSGVQTISDAELASFYIGGNVKYRAGTRLVKITTDPRVYAVEPTGTLRHVPDEATAVALYGSTWAQQIDDLNDAFFAPPNYNIGSALPTGGATLPKGYLASDGTTTYYIDGTTKRPISGQAAMDANHFWTMFVHTVPASTLSGLTNGTSINGAEASLLDVSQGGTGSVVVPTGSGVTIALASDTPVANTLPDGTIYNPILKLNVTASADGDAQLTGLTMTRGGFIANTNVTGVSVWDQSGVRHGAILTSIGSDGRGTVGFGSDPIIIPAGQTRSVTVAINLSADTGSATVNMGIASAADLTFLNSPAKNGSFPITGNTMSIVDGSTTVGSVTVAGQATVGCSIACTSGNLEVGQTQMEVAKFNFNETTSREDAQVRQLVMYVEGDVNDASDLANFTVYGPDGIALGSTAHSVGRYATINLTTPYTVPQGSNRNLTVKVDATGGANRWFRLQIQNDYDLLIRGVTTGANLLPASAPFDGGSSWTAISSTSGYFKIKQGALTIAKNAASPSGNVTVGATNVELGRFDLTANGENLEVRKIGIAIVATNASDLSLTGNLSLVGTDGITYYTGTASSTTLYNEGTSAVYTTQTTLSNYLSLTTGVTKTIKVMVNISTNATAGRTIQVGLGNAYVRRLSSLDYANVPDGTGTAAQTLTIGASTLTVTKHTIPSDPTIVAPGTANALIGTFAVGNTAVGSEDVRVNSIAVNAAFTTAAITSLTNLKLYDITGGTETQLGSTLSSPSANGNSFNVNWTVPANSTRVLAVKGDINSTVSNGDTLRASLTANAIVGSGVGSGNTIQGPAAAVNGQLNSMAAAAVRVFFAQDGTVASRVIAAGTDNTPVAMVRIETDNEDVDVYKLTLRVSTTAAILSSSTENIQASGTSMFESFSLYDGTTPLGTAYLTNIDEDITDTTASQQTVAGVGASSSARLLFNFSGTGLRVLNGVGKNLTLKMNTVGSGSGVTSTVLAVGLHSNSNSFVDIRSGSRGQLEATSIETTSTSNTGTLSNYHLVLDSAPTVSPLTITNHSLGTTAEIGQFEIRNDSQGSIVLSTIGFTINGSGLTFAGTATDTVTDFMLYVGNTAIATPDSAYWTALCGGATSTGDGIAGKCGGVVNTTSTLFSVNGTVGTGWADYKEINPGTSRIFSLRANTLSMRNAGGTGVRSLTAQVTGTAGFLFSNSATSTAGGTRLWNTSGLTYTINPAGPENAGPMQDVFIATTLPVEGSTY